MTNADAPPTTTMRGRARVAMITVARNVLSGNSRTNMRAMMPTNVPTFMRSLKLFAHRRGEGQTNAHPFDVLLDGLLLAGEPVGAVERLDLVGERGVVNVRANAQRQVRQRVRRELCERLVPT